MTTRTVLSPSWREHLAGAVGAAVVDDDDLALDGQLDRAHAPHDLDDRVALVVDGHDDRQLPVLAPSSLRLLSPLPPVPVVRAGETFAEVDLRLPAEHLLGERDVGTALRRDRPSGSGSNTISDFEPVTSSTSVGELEHRELVGVADVHRPDVRRTRAARARPPTSSST